jgi:lipase
VKLCTSRWGPAAPTSVVCIHGVGQRGAVFKAMGERLVAAGHSVVAVDLRGHGGSGHEPPWSTDTHVEDVLETVESLDIERVQWVGHSFGGRVAATLAARAPEMTERLVLLDPGLGVPPALALRHAEIDRLDWSFATVDGAVNALLTSDSVVAAPEDVIVDYAQGDLKKGADGRFRFSFCPSAAVAAWGELTLPPPPVAQAPTLLVRAEMPLFDPAKQVLRYAEALGDLLTSVTVPNGHNVLWESPAETLAAVEGFLAMSEAAPG